MNTTTEAIASGYPTLRRNYHQALGALEGDLLKLGEQARGALLRSVEALAAADGEACMAVAGGDDDIDRRYRKIEGTVLRLLAQQAPVATELRLLSAVLHIALHLERVGDSAVNVAVLGSLCSQLPADPGIVESVVEMGRRAADMVDDTMRAFTVRSATAAAGLLAADDAVDDLERRIFQSMLDITDDRREWALRMLQVSRQLERAADHAVDIAEEIAFVAGGTHAGTGRQPE